MLPTRLGVHAVDGGVEAAVHAPHADRVSLCVFDGSDEQRFALPDRVGSLHHGLVGGLVDGARYGFRVHGPGHHEDQLLLDPYARAVEGSFRWHPTLWPEHRGDSAPHVPRSVVVDTEPGREWQRPRIPWSDTVIYETHVKGISRTHPEVPPHLRGTYAALGSEPMVDHLRRLGITTVELLPIARFVHERRLLSKGLRQYWGYMPISLLAPHAAYAAASKPADVVAEVQQMVGNLHAAGIEVILDVVLNHTGEGEQDGPWIGLRGFDDLGYYRHRANNTYEDVTGTGNTLDLGYPPALRLALDALRHWVTDYGVDGFRFDLAATLLRSEDPTTKSAFLAAVAQDPILSSVKLIAEPWDLGVDGYRLGTFPSPWREWNDKFRDTVRDAFRSRPGVLPELATRATGSSDLFGRRLRPTASVNFVTAHDGPTLADLVSYQSKHNEANGEANHDGGHDQRAWNGGVEGPTLDPAITAERARRVRSMLALTILARGVPMINGGDELGRTQLGNTNAYCQDTKISWHDWGSADEDLMAFTQQVIALRGVQLSLSPDSWLTGEPIQDGRPDAEWFGVDGSALDDWHQPGLSILGLRLAGDPDVATIVNTGSVEVDVQLPERGWRVHLDTAGTPDRPEYVERVVTVQGFGLVLLAKV